MLVDLNQEEIGLILEWHRRAHSGVVCSVRSSNLAARLRNLQWQIESFPVGSVVLVKNESGGQFFGRVMSPLVGDRYLIQTTNWNDNSRFVQVHKEQLSKP